MNRKQVVISLLAVPFLGLLMALAGSQYSQLFNGYPIFAIGITVAFLINTLGFLPAYLLQTEKFYDLVGTSTYIVVTLLAFQLSEDMDVRGMLICTLVVIWAIRLGVFLFSRVHRVGKDDRFDDIKPDFLRFLNVWGLQALWVTFTAAAALVVITSTKRVPLGIFAYLGLAVWLVGFGIEILADYQKTQFRKQPENRHKFIQTGLWSRSRHPNYFGEITLWIGISIIALPVLQGWQWIALLSPVFVAMLLTKVSGIPMLQAKAEEKWGDQEDYKNYKANTPLLIPKI